MASTLHRLVPAGPGGYRGRGVRPSRSAGRWVGETSERWIVRSASVLTGRRLSRREVLRAAAASGIAAIGAAGVASAVVRTGTPKGATAVDQLFESPIADLAGALAVRRRGHVPVRRGRRRLPPVCGRLARRPRDARGAGRQLRRQGLAPRSTPRSLPRDVPVRDGPDRRGGGHRTRGGDAAEQGGS